LLSFLRNLFLTAAAIQIHDNKVPYTNDNCNIIWQPGTYTNAADFNLDGTVNNKDFAAIAGTWLWQAAWY